MIDMSGWASVSECGRDEWRPRVLTREEVRELLEEGRRVREHYQREIRRMRALTPEEWSARVR